MVTGKVDEWYKNKHRLLQFASGASNRWNVKLIPSVQVLILDAIPTEWLILEQNTASQLTLFKVQRACVYDVYSLFHRTSFHNFPTLTHLRLSECAIGELSGLVF
jgi:hypothetical protein